MVGGLIGALGVSAGFFANDILFLFFSHGIVTGNAFLLYINITIT